jgi:aspartate carbamoyltransferase regulatory subunit
MKYKAEPNLLVTFKKPVGTIRYIKFDNDGYYITDNEHIIKKLSQHFPSEDLNYKCKYCGKSFDNKGNLLVHYRGEKCNVL